MQEQEQQRTRAETERDRPLRAPETVCITGSSSGIGRATARAFLDEGWDVYATSRSPEDVADLRERGCETIELDVTDEGRVDAAIDRIVGESGRIDCLVNCAGYGQFGPLEDVPPEDLHHQFDVNVYGPHRLARAALPHMREAGDGTIVNVSSAAGRLAFPGGGAYCGSKFALEAMSDALRAEVAEFGVDVVLVEPGPVATNFTDRADDEVETLPRTAAYDRLYSVIDDAWTLGGSPRTIPPEDVADTIVNAASSTQPATRYPVGPSAKAAGLARLVPDRFRDLAFRVAIKVLS